MDAEKLRLLRDLASDRVRFSDVGRAEATLLQLAQRELIESGKETAETISQVSVRRLMHTNTYSAAKALGRMVRLQKSLAKTRPNAEGSRDQRLTPERRRELEEWLQKECGNLAVAVGFESAMAMMKEMGVDFNGG